ncbi:Hypothetical protein D9617_4g003070 [Elsinoe fawcettii]|nr:Hypothetical protein D9617_4g003070 [Elsinoe fawcettii]
MATRAIVQRGLLGLPVDVKRHIVDKIWPPKSQRDLALVCRETYMLVQPEMYKSLDFKIETTHDTKITNMLTEHNLDLAHVRHVLSQLVYEEDDNYVAQHCRIAKGVFSRLMSLLPSDSLLSFYATADMTLSLSWYRELLERQARITSLSVNTILFKKTRIGQFDDEHPAFGNKIQHVESLYLLPHQDHDLEFCHYVLHHCNSLKILTIAMANEKAVSSLPAFPENDWQDTAYMPGMLTRSVFRSQLRAGPDQTITGIRELELSN